MPRNSRQNIKSSFFHIMVQGINKEYIFNSDKDKKEYLKFINKNKNDYNIEIIAYCIMNNHVHLLVKINKMEDLSKFMHKVNTLYGFYYNKVYQRVGYVFRDRYKSQPIYSEKQMYICINYIHNNPVKAKICKHPKEYIFSSFETYNKETKNFYNIENNDEKINICFLEDEEQIEIEIKEYIELYLNFNKINIEQLRKDKIVLKKLIRKLKENYNISFRKMEKYIGISREKIRQLK